MSEAESRLTPGIRIRVPTGEAAKDAARCFVVGYRFSEFLTNVSMNREYAGALAGSFAMGTLVDILEDSIRSCGVDHELDDALGALRRNMKNKDVEGVQTAARMALDVLGHK